jgi:hypothetical protein
MANKRISEFDAIAPEQIEDGVYLLADTIATLKITFLQLKGYILSGVKTIFGVTTFDDIPVLPSTSCSTDNQAARKKYVDDQDTSFAAAQTLAAVAARGATMPSSTDLNMNTNKITNVVDPTSNQHAATKKYVDDLITASTLHITVWINSLVWGSNGLGTLSNVSIWTRRVGDTMHVRGTIKFGTVSASTAYLSLPSGYTLDTAKFGSGTNVHTVGRSYFLPTNSALNLNGSSRSTVAMFYDGSTNDKIYLGYNSTSFAIDKVNGSDAFSNNDVLSFQFDIPISGWGA